MQIHVFFFTFFLETVVNLHPENRTQINDSSPYFIFADCLEKETRTNGESWPNDFDEKVKRDEDFRRVSSKWRLAAA